MKYVGQFPLPPSVNQAYRNVPRVGRVKTGVYKAWEKEAAKCLLAFPVIKVEGPVRASYTYARPSARRMDLANREKCLSDFLTKAGVMNDDSDIHHMTLQWASNDNKTLIAGWCEVVIEPL